MTWSDQHDILLCREVLVEEPYRFKSGTRERGQSWDKVANALNAQENIRFSVDQRAVRDRLQKITKVFKRRMAAEERASGINPEKTELDEALESVIERSEGAQEEILRGDSEKRRQAEKDRETAEDVRKRSMERYAATRARDNAGSVSVKRKRDSGAEAVGFLMDKGKQEIELRREELELQRRELLLKEKRQEEEFEMRRREQNLKEREQEAREKKDETLLQMFAQQQRQQEALFAYMQQQNQAILSLVDSLKK